MSRNPLLLSLMLVALGLAGETKQTTIAGQNTKSTMRKIYEEDQENRNDTAGDARRRLQVRQLINDGKLQTAEDYYYAAFIYQHGQQPSDYLYAHVLAVTAVDKGLHNAMWLSAATLDRYLHAIRKSQVFGTQFGSLYDNRDDQEPYNRGMVSDGLRAQWCVASISAQGQILSDTRAGKEFRSTRTCPLPDAQFDK
jgi:hypothetical protein